MPLNKVTENVWIGDAPSARDERLLEEEGISAALNLTMEPENHPFAGEGGEDGGEENGTMYLALPQKDEMDTTIALYLEEGVPFIASAVEAGHRVVVFCQAGISRSATTVIAYLMAHVEGMERVADSFRHLRSARSIVTPNVSFMAQLLEHEAERGVDPPSLLLMDYVIDEIAVHMVPGGPERGPQVRALLEAYVASTPSFSFTSSDHVNLAVSHVIDALFQSP